MHANATLIDRFLTLCGSPRLVTLLNSDATTRSSAAEIWAIAQGSRNTFRRWGLQRGDVLAIAAPNSLELLAAMVAAWADGIAVLLLPHELGRRTTAPAKFLAALEQVKPRGLLVADSAVDAPPGFEALTHNMQELRDQGEGIDSHALPPSCLPSDIAVIQMTSGSTGTPKAAVITHAMLAANCAAIEERIALRADDRVVSWLPLHHDMGLSCITQALWGGVDLVLMPTSMFVRRPLSWLEAISEYRGTLSPAPASAYALLARYAGAALRAGVDLSSWRYALAGAEPVFESHLRQFRTAMRPLNLRENVVLPSYGMAETVVASSMNVPGLSYTTLWVDSSTLYREGRVRSISHESDGAVCLVSNGKPIAGLEIIARDGIGRDLNELSAGRLHIRGSSVIRQYLHRGPACDAEGWYDTGDIGFISEGHVYICGRAKDVITRSGLNICSNELEDAVESSLSLRKGTVAAFSCIDAESNRERIVVVVGKTPAENEALQLRQAVSRAVASRVGIQVDDIVFVKRSELPKTTSGKLERSALRLAYQRGELNSTGSRFPAAAAACAVA